MSDNYVISAHDVPIGWSEERSTPDLRFVRRDGKLLLQQRFSIRTRNSEESEWRDVPVHDEESNRV